MPDGLTHLLTAYVSLHRRADAGRMSLLLVGSLLPDLLLRGGRLFFQGNPEQDSLELFLAPLHTPFACFFICLALAQLVNCQIRKTSFAFLYLGCTSHFVLDLFQRTIVGFGVSVELLDGYHWLYPISWFDFQAGLIWAEDASYALLLLIPLSIWFYLFPVAHELP